MAHFEEIGFGPMLSARTWHQYTLASFCAYCFGKFSFDKERTWENININFSLFQVSYVQSMRWIRVHAAMNCSAFVGLIWLSCGRSFRPTLLYVIYWRDWYGEYLLCFATSWCLEAQFSHFALGSCSLWYWWSATIYSHFYVEGYLGKHLYVNSLQKRHWKGL